MTEVCPHCGSTLTVDENHADAVLYDQGVAKELADLFVVLHRGGVPWSDRPLNRFERFMARPWRAAR